MKNRIINFLFVTGLVFISCYHGGCIQSKKYYEVKLTEKQQAEIAEKAAQKVIEAQKLKID